MRLIMRMAAIAVIAGILLGAVFMSFPEKANASEGKVVRVGWFDSTYCYKDQFGRRSGLAYDYQQKVSAYTEWTYDYVEGTWPELLQKLNISSLMAAMAIPLRFISMKSRREIKLQNLQPE